VATVEMVLPADPNYPAAEQAKYLGAHKQVKRFSEMSGLLIQIMNSFNSDGLGN
jgi:hypothetical protein